MIGYFPMEIIPAEISRVDQIMDLVRSCVEDLSRKGITQWNEHYPTEEIIRNDIARSDLFMAVDSGRCRGIVVINDIQVREWCAVDWSAAHTRPLAVHRLMVRPEFQRSGVGRLLMDFARDHAAAHGHDAVRFDVYSGNPQLVATYERMGCVRKGEVFFPHRGLPFYCYEFGLESARHKNAPKK